MKAFTHQPSEIFGAHVRYVVPLFQRPYVWNKRDQWQPLWDDVAVLADKVHEAASAPYGTKVSPHFLGAIVLEQQLTPGSFIGTFHIIDGQQRLTTLQLLLDAAQEVAELFGHPMDAQALRVLVLNDASIAKHPDHVFKVWPTDRDQAAFRAAMTNGAVAPKEHASSLVSEAHAFFVNAIHSWAGIKADAEAAKERLHALVTALRDYLKLVRIDLEPDDNAQVIFETLNHRGSPLLAADLVKNYLFQRLEAEQADVGALYAKYWKDLDTDRWRAPVAQGRRYRPRIDVFLTYWLTMMTRDEVPNDRVFADFKEFMSSAGHSPADVLQLLSRDAKVYSDMETFPATSVEGTFRYRVLGALDTASVGPVLLWLLRWPEGELPKAERDLALRSIESWLVRRSLCRLTGKGVNLVMVEILKRLHEAGPSEAGQEVARFLSEQGADARLWPSDDAVRQALKQEPVYTSFVRARVRMLLEALENDLRKHYGQEPCPLNLTVEHVMPRSWREYWNTPPLSAEAAAERDRRVHTLGNLSLIEGKLNTALSNRPWTSQDASAVGLDAKGKSDYLMSHNVLKLNGTLLSEHAAEWTDEDIDARTTVLTEKLISFWPRPAEAAEDTPLPTDAELVEEPADEPEPRPEQEFPALAAWLANQTSDEVLIAFAELADVLETEIPSEARTQVGPWYANGGSLGRAIAAAGWRPADVDLEAELVRLRRET